MPRITQIAALIEVFSLLTLLVNLGTAHVAWVSSAIGPIHGCAYLVVIAATVSTPTTSTRTRWLSAVPGIGGLLAVRADRRNDADSESRTTRHSNR